LPKQSANRSPEELKQLVEQARKASELLKALSHETRLLILCLLAEGELSVSELEAALDMPLAAVSQQLARLRLDRLVVTRREGRTVYYAIASKEVASVVETLHDLFCKPVRDNGERTNDLAAE
jgi:DNA-binding transcriptional ArsR family regulator